MANLRHSLKVEEAFHSLSSSREGLTAGEVAARLKQFGPNEIRRRKPVCLWRLLLKQFESFFVGILLIAATLAYAVSFLPGESGRRLTALVPLWKD